jgi:hypothetical protein
LVVAAEMAASKLEENFEEVTSGSVFTINFVMNVHLPSPLFACMSNEFFFSQYTC